MPKTDNTFQLNQATTKIIPICICLQVCISQPVRSLEHSCVNLYPIKTCFNTIHLAKLENYSKLITLRFNLRRLTCGFTLREKGEHWFPRQFSDLETENHFVNVNRLIERSFFESLIEQSRLCRLAETVLCHHQMTFLSIIFGSSQ